MFSWRTIFFSVLLFLSERAVVAQSSKQDSIINRYDSLAKEKYKKADSSDNRVTNKIDATQSTINKLLNPDLNQLVSKDKLERKKQRHDSIQFYKKLETQKKQVRSKIDSLEKIQQPSSRYVLQLDSLNKVKFTPHKKASIAHQADSLQSINLSTGKYTARLDSLNQLDPNKYTKHVEAKANELQNNVSQPAGKIQGTVNEKLNLMNKEGRAGANLPSNAALPNTPLVNTQLPNAQLPTTQLKTENPLSNVNNPLQDKIGDVKGLPQEQIGKVKSIDEIQSAQSKLGKANAITDKAQGYSKDVKNISKGDMGEVKELPKAAEEKAGKLGMNQLQEETGKFDQYKGLADKAKDPKALKEEALKQAPKLAVNHFAGKEAVLQQAMEKMEKLKSKYTEFNSIKDLPKHKPNAMKGKPLIERLTPGITLQLQRKGDVLMDYNPFIGYRFYERFTAGFGWNERFTIGNSIHLSLSNRIYGPRVFADFKIGKGFSVRTDIEKMNTYVPALTPTGYSTDTEYRAWVWSAFIGLKKEYKFSKRIKGNAQFLYNLYDDHNNSPYAERLAVRMGFEVAMKMKKRTPKVTPR